MTVERTTRPGRAWPRWVVLLTAVLAGGVGWQGFDLGALGHPAAVQKDKGKDKDKDKGKDKDKDKGKDKEKPPRTFKTIPEASYKGHGDWINRLAVNADGTLLATASRDGTV